MIRVTLFPRDESQPIVDATPDDIGAYVNDALASEGIGYILVCALTEEPGE